MSALPVGALLLAIAALLLGALVWAAFRWGESRAELKTDQRTIEVKDAQLQAGARRPDAAAVARELRDGSF